MVRAASEAQQGVIDCGRTCSKMHFRFLVNSLRNRPQVHNPNGSRENRAIDSQLISFVSFFKA